MKAEDAQRVFREKAPDFLPLLNKGTFWMIGIFFVVILLNCCFDLLLPLVFLLNCLLFVICFMFFLLPFRNVKISHHSKCHI